MSDDQYSPKNNVPVSSGRRKLLKSGLAAFAVTPLAVKGGSGSPATVGKGPVSKPPKFTPVAQPTNIESLFEVIKREATPEELYCFLYAMPKGGDIHHHLGGGFFPEMWYRVAADSGRNGGQRFYTRYKVSSLRRHPLLNAPGVSYVFQWRTLNQKSYDSLGSDFQKDFKPLPELNETERKAWMSAIVLDEKGEGRNEFFEYHWTRLGDLLSSIHVMSELLVENMKLFSTEGLRYLELQRGAFHYLDAACEALPAQEADAFWNDRLAKADALETGVVVRWQGVVIRFLPNAEQQVRDFYAHIDSNRDTWGGINMAGREDDNRGYPARFTQVFDEMLRKYPGIGISIHAGEAEKPDSHIRDTLRLGATRIGHGINLLSDEDMLLRMRDSNFLVEINLISNDLLGYVPNLGQHPFPIYLRQGIPCCLNTDDRGMWDSNYTDEVFVAVKHFNLSWAELQKLSRMSYQHSFADAATKQARIEGFESDLGRFEAQFSESNWRSVVGAVPAITHGYGRHALGLKLA